MKHYGRYLPDSGALKNQVNDIEVLYLRKASFEQQLIDLEEKIKNEENDFLEYIKKEWTPEEIQEAKEKAEKQPKTY